MISSHAVLFVAISVIFLVVTLRDVLQREERMTPARLTYLRIALIFAVVSIILYAVDVFDGAN